jgi:hypothetical protein
MKEVRAAAFDLDVADLPDGLVAALRPVYRLDPVPHGPHRVGGPPDLVAEERWPLAIAAPS